MTKKSLLLSFSLPLLAMVVMISGCNQSERCPRCEEEVCQCPDQEWFTKVREETDRQPEMVNVIIDKSKSMEGYFEPSAVHNILVTVNDLVNSGTRRGTVRLMGDAPMANYASGLQNASNFGKDTDMKQIMASLMNCGNDTVNALVTDGIVSSANGVNDVPQMMSEIESMLKSKKNFGYAIFRFEAPYNGTYYIESTRTSGYQTVDLDYVARPYFVIMVGDADRVRYLCDNPPFKGGYEKLSFNTHGDYTDLRFFPTNDKTVFCGPDSASRHFYLLDDEPGQCDISFRFPASMKARIQTLGPKNANLTLNGQTIKEWKINVDDNQANISITDADDVLELANSSDNALVLKFQWKDTKKWIDDFSSDDDSFIGKSISEQKKTYGLKYLIETFEAADPHPDVVVTLSFEKV